MTALQPPPLECQWCGRDIKQGPHKPTCRVVLETDTLEVPGHLKRPRETKE